MSPKKVINPIKIYIIKLPNIGTRGPRPIYAWEEVFIKVANNKDVKNILFQKFDIILFIEVCKKKGVFFES